MPHRRLRRASRGLRGAVRRGLRGGMVRTAGACALRRARRSARGAIGPTPTIPRRRPRWRIRRGREPGSRPSRKKMTDHLRTLVLAPTCSETLLPGNDSTASPGRVDTGSRRGHVGCSHSPGRHHHAHHHPRHPRRRVARSPSAAPPSPRPTPARTATTPSASARPTSPARDKGQEISTGARRSRPSRAASQQRPVRRGVLRRERHPSRRRPEADPAPASPATSRGAPPREVLISGVISGVAGASAGAGCRPRGTPGRRPRSRTTRTTRPAATGRRARRRGPGRPAARPA